MWPAGVGSKYSRVAQHTLQALSVGLNPHLFAISFNLCFVSHLPQREGQICDRSRFEGVIQEHRQRPKVIFVIMLCYNEEIMSFL